MSEQVNQVSPNTNQAVQTASENVNTFGYFLDGWADLIEGMGDKAGAVREKVLAGLKQKEMPDVRSGPMKGIVSVIGGETRDYLVAKTEPGATTTIYIAKFGSDLYASWRTFIKPVINKKVILVLLGIAAVVGLFTGGIRQSSGYWGGGSNISFSLMGWLGSFLTIAAVVFGGAALAGRFLKGRFLAFFVIEPNVFDAEDITAMGLAAHKTILRSLDNAGIDVTKLRLKQNFKGGRRDEMV